MAKLVYGLNQSLDGYVDHDAFASPGPLLFRHFIEQTGALTGSLYGRRMYETMRYWDQADFDQHDPRQTDALRDYSEAWRRQPKWVVSRTLQSLGPNAALVEADLETAVRKLKAERAGVIQVGGPELAQSLTALGLIDEYQIYLRPFVVGQGKPFFASARPPLRLIASDQIGEDALRLTYVPA